MAFIYLLSSNASAASAVNHITIAAFFIAVSFLSLCILLLLAYRAPRTVFAVPYAFIDILGSLLVTVLAPRRPHSLGRRSSRREPAVWFRLVLDNCIRLRHVQDGP